MSCVGAVVAVRLGGARQRGVVIGLEDSPPEGVEAAPIERVVESLPAPLVELALWLADYYGSTPGRALALVAPPKRARRKELPQPAERDALGGEPEPQALTAAQERALARLRRAYDEGGGHFLLYGATGSGKTEVYLQAAGDGARPRPRRDRPRPRDRARAADRGPLPGTLRRPRGDPALVAERGGAARRARARSRQGRRRS